LIGLQPKEKQKWRSPVDKASVRGEGVKARKCAKLEAENPAAEGPRAKIKTGLAKKEGKIIRKPNGKKGRGL